MLRWVALVCLITGSPAAACVFFMLHWLVED